MKGLSQIVYHHIIPISHKRLKMSLKILNFNFFKFPFQLSHFNQTINPKQLFDLD